jgi:hypothetical protein
MGQGKYRAGANCDADNSAGQTLDPGTPKLFLQPIEFQGADPIRKLSLSVRRPTQGNRLTALTRCCDSCVTGPANFASKMWMLA